MKKVVFYWFSLYFVIVCTGAGTVKNIDSVRPRRSIDLISSLEHVADVRLPRDVAPLGYRLELHPFLEEGEFQGHVTINITCVENTDKIILHAHQELEIADGDVTVYLIPSPNSIKKEGLVMMPGETAVKNISATTTTTSTTTTTTISATTAEGPLTTMIAAPTVKPTEPYVAPVPVGAARLVPVSSSFIPENACLSATSCASNPVPEKEGEKPKPKETQPKIKEMLPKAEPLVGVVLEELEKTIAEMATTESVSETLENPEPEAEELPSQSAEIQMVPLTISKIERQASKQWYIIYVTGGLKRGENYQLDIKFTGALLTNSKDGFFVESYMDKRSGVKKYYAATQLRPNHARRVFPCFDEPSYKVPFEIHVARSPKMTTISNMLLSSTDRSPTEDDWEWDHFHRSPPMSTYSLAVLISDLEHIILPEHFKNGEIPDRVEVWGRKGMLSPLKNAAKIAPKIVKAVEIVFDMKLPVPKLDIIALPGYTAIPDSNWGLIFFKESDLYSDEHLVKHMTREVVYQWIGNLVTPHWWSDVHINKALCNFLAYMIAVDIDQTAIPNSDLWTKTYPLYYEYGRNQPYRQLPSQKPPKTVTKSELILRMLNYTLSAETFIRAIRQLVNERQHKTFTQEDIWSALTEQAGVDGMLPEPATINQIADSWIKKERLPVVTVIRNYEKSSAEVEQSVFIRDHLDGNSTEADENLTWFIPLVVVPQNNLNFTTTKPIIWMKEEKKVTITDLPSSSFFIIVNPEEIGPFIVNYDLHNWFLLSEFFEKYANNGQIPAATRAKVIHDSLNLAYAGDLRFDAALNMTKFLFNEKDPIVWQAAFNMFDHIQRHLEGSDSGKKFQEYIKYIVSNVYSYLEKIELKHTRSQDRMYKSAKSALCNAGYRPCIKEARAQWKKWMDFDEPDSGIPISQSHFCWVFKWGTKEEWEFGLERYLNYPANHKQADKYYLLKTLVSCPTNAWNVERLLNMTMLDPNVTITDGNARFILNVLSNQAGYTALFNLLADNWDAIKAKFDNKESNLWDNIVSAATKNFKNQDGLDMVSELYVERQGEFGSAESVIEQSLKQIKKEVKWNEDNLSVIDQWLTDFLAIHSTETQITD